MRVRVLGSLRALAADGADLTPAGPLQRRLLALLVLRRGRVVPADTAVDVLWPDAPPRDPSGALQNHLSRLRQSLPAGAIESVGEGYRLDPSRIEVDSDGLLSLLDAAATGDTGALAALRDLLADWQGPAFPELGDVDDGRAESARLGELRQRACEVVAEQRLARGDTDGLVAELSALAEAEPLRERPQELLMAALVQAGRRVDALRAYDDFRRRLGDELGIEPSPALAARHAALLEGAPQPGAPQPGAPAPVLPVPTTSLVGRDELEARATDLAERCRLLTLVGPGGVGKTRLLLELGHVLRARRADRGVVLCELATADHGSAVHVVAAALGVDLRAGVPPAAQLATVLGDRALVLLLDNCEHVLEPVAELVSHLLTRCPNLRVAATSRERLRVAGEHVCVVPTLVTDGDDSPAVQLFLDRAAAVVPGFAPDAGEVDAIGEIVRRLDGLPLAIELAAARLFTHDVHEVRAGLDQRFALLTSGDRTSSRHGSLGAAVSWSLGLLDEPLQRFFASLASFSGPFTVEGAAAVADCDETWAAEALARLVERSLVQRVPRRRYALLESLRAFGADRLAATGELDVVAGRHARHLVSWAEEADRRFLVSGDAVAAEIDAALPELHLALGWLLDHGEVETAGRIVAALIDYGILRLRPDVLGWAERVAASDPHDGSPLASRVWVAAAYAAWMAGDVAGCGVRSERALAAAEAHSDLPAEVATIRGSHELFLGNLEEAARWYRRGSEIAAAAGDTSWDQFVRATEVLALGYAGDPTTDERSRVLLAEIGTAETPHAAYAWYCTGEADLRQDPGRARERFTRAIEIAARTRTSFVTGLAGASKASIDARAGDPVAAAHDYRWLIDHWRRAGMWSTQWTMLRSIAGLLARLDRPRDAAVLLGAIRATGAGHRIFGEDRVTLDELEHRLRSALGEDQWSAAFAEGAALDGDAAVEHALRSLGGPVLTSAAAHPAHPGSPSPPARG